MATQFSIGEGFAPRPFVRLEGRTADEKPATLSMAINRIAVRTARAGHLVLDFRCDVDGVPKAAFSLFDFGSGVDLDDLDDQVDVTVTRSTPIALSEAGNVTLATAKVAVSKAVGLGEGDDLEDFEMRQLCEAAVRSAKTGRTVRLKGSGIAISGLSLPPQEGKTWIDENGDEHEYERGITAFVPRR